MSSNFFYWMEKLLAAFAGGALSLAFVVPKDWKDAVIRIVGSTIFGAYIGDTITNIIETSFKIPFDAGEKSRAGPFICGFLAWVILGHLYERASKGRLPPSSKKSGEGKS